ncbi:MAG: penicillin-binding protein 2 [Lewinellaceae bacterium]|nr:penicillin-binding protein 2 [Lewinellaceae bacterium]
MPSTQSRQLSIQVLFVVAALILGFQALNLQVLDKTFRSKADTVAIEKYTNYPARGLIYDREGRLMVYNNPMYDLLVTYNQINWAMDTAKFCELLEIDREYFVQNLQKDWRSGRFSKSVPFVFLSKISAERFARFQESLYQFPGFEVQLRNAREYPIPVAAHVLGYIREVNKAETEKTPETYVPGDYIGASGLEQSYEDHLRGEKGFSFILKDNLGRVQGAYKNGTLDTEPKSGKDLITSIDLELQLYAEKLMQNKRGGIVAIEPATGEILAMISAPTYDPNQLTITNNNRGDAYMDLQTDENIPLFNRAISAQYPPGSLFKPLLALVALQKETLKPNRTIGCSGGYFLGGQRLTGCHGHPTCTSVSMAIQHSCNAYFVTVFRELLDAYGSNNPGRGLDTLSNYLSAFGFGKPLGVDFPGEKPGNYPTTPFYNNWFKGQRWNSVWVRSVGIGQGEMLTTNLQLANAAAMIANRGWFITPHLVKGYRNSQEKIDAQYRTPRKVGIRPEYFDLVVDGMEKVTIAGTARRAFIEDISVCGKTGTAENPHGEDHSIFFCFAPKENPKIAIAVYIENAGFGGTYAAPIASLMIEKYIKGEIRGTQRQWLETQMLEKNLLNIKP